MKNLYQKLAWGIAFTIVVYAGIGIAADLGDSLQYFSLNSSLIALAAVGLTLFNYALRFVKWHIFLNRIETPVAIVESAVVFVAGFLMVITPGKLGEVFKSYLLKQTHGYAPSRTAPVVIMERLTDLLGLFILASLGIATFEFGRPVFAVSTAIVVGIIVLLNQETWIRGLISMLGDIPGIRRFSDTLERAYNSIYRLVDWWTVTWTSLLSALAWGMEAVAFYMIILHLGGDVTLLVAAFVYAMTTILGAVSFLPGGVGVTEGSMIGILVLFGVFPQESLATAATYFIRLTTLWFGVIVGFIGFSWHQYVFAGADDRN